MPRWPLLIPPPAVSKSTSPSRSRGSLLSILVKSPSCRPSPSSRRHGRTVPCRRVAIAVVPSLAIAPRPPSPSICHRAIHRRPSPLCSRSIAAALAQSLAIEEPLRRPLPSRSHRVIHCRRCQGAIAPSLAVEEPSRRPSPSRSRRAAVRCCCRQFSPSRSRRPAGCHASLLLTPTPPICRRLRLSFSSRRRRLLSRPS
jgi:hypothetical protein